MPNISKFNGFDAGSTEARLEALEREFQRLSDELYFVLQNLGDDNLNQRDLGALLALCSSGGRSDDEAT